MKRSRQTATARVWLLTALLLALGITGFASSHREAPLISNDPQADNTDLYVFRSPDDTNTITIIANYIPFELPEGGPNYYTFGQNIRYEIHVKNKTSSPLDDITYRFTFTQVSQDTTTFFNIRLGKENLKTTYTVEKSVNGGTFSIILSNGVVPPPNIGPRSIQGNPVGLGASSYASLMQGAIGTTSSGEKVYCGPVDDPFFVDLGGVFDLASIRPNGNAVNAPKDGLARYNVHSICIKVPISTLQATGLGVSSATSILDPAFVIGVWASASRQQLKTLNANGTTSYSGSWVQVSRLGMPLVNEAIIGVADKDLWNVANPAADGIFEHYFKNPELALYIDKSQFASAVPALNGLRIQTASLGTYDFRNGKKGLFPLKGTAAVSGTALDDAIFGNVLLQDSASPRSLDILPVFYTGVPNLSPYQLATGKGGNPLAAGKPFINNFLPTFGDMLRLNMAVPVTPRNDPNFSSLGILKACVLGLTDPAYNTTANLQFIPNMDGFPNGRRLEDDVTTIELQAVSGIVLAAIGLWYDDFVTGGSPVTPMLQSVIGFTAGPVSNDTTFQAIFPYEQEPWRGYDYTLKERM